MRWKNYFVFIFKISNIAAAVAAPAQSIRSLQYVFFVNSEDFYFLYLYLLFARL
jgi:hypothetical protein